MKSAILLSLTVLLCKWGSCRCQTTGGLTSAVTGQFNTLNRQLSVVQAVLSELSRSLGEAVNTGTRAVNSNTESLASSFMPVVNQLSALQQALNSVASQAQRIVDSGTRIVTGQPLAAPEALDVSAAPAPNSTTGSDATVKTVTAAAASTPHETAGVGPAIVLVKTVDSASKQLGQMTSVVESLSRQMTNILTTGARTLAINRLNPTDSVLEVIEEYVKQISDIQKSLRNANNQLNRLLETGSFSGGPANHRQKRADTMVVTGMQKALTELTQELGRIGGTLARIAGGVSGVRIPGAETDSRGAAESSSAFQGLNPVGVISRGLGNLASSVSRIIPATGRK